MAGTADLVARALVPAVVLTVFALLRRYLPSRRASSLPAPITASELADFENLKWVVGAAMVIVGAAFAFISYETLLHANQYLGNTDGPARFQVLPTRYIWWFFPLFGPLTFTWEITLRLWSLAGGGKKAERYEQWSNDKAGFNCTRVLRWMAIVIALPVGLATLLAVPMHTTLRDHDMVIRGYGWRWSRHYFYSQARRLATIHGFRERSGKFDVRAEILIDFPDGYRWHSEDNRDFVPTVNPDLLKFLEQKTGLQVEEFETERELQPI